MWAANARFLRAAAAGVFVTLALGACSMDTPTQLSRRPILLEEGPAYKTMPVAAADESALRALAREYERLGQGAVELTVTYDPQSPTNTALNATEQAARIAEALRYMGMKPIETAILPVNMQGDKSQLMLQYKAITAHAPEGCEYMNGVENRETATVDDYSFGCTYDMILARQIARPKDLGGGEGLAPGDGRRSTVLNETYTSGGSAPPLPAVTTTN